MTTLCERTAPGSYQESEPLAPHGYAVWHYLRRLRGRLGSRPASRMQASPLFSAPDLSDA